MSNIIEILDFIDEDKHTNFTTTSNKFKEDLWNFFDNENFKTKTCLELGTHKGQTTRVLSYLFEKVITVNRNEESLEAAKKLNADRGNIEYVPFDLYNNDLETKITEDEISVAFVDAGHARDQVIYDIERIRKLNLNDEMYFVFDDFGMHDPVYEAINIYMMNNILIYQMDIGHRMGYNFGGMPARILKNGAEGIICKLEEVDG